MNAQSFNQIIPKEEYGASLRGQCRRRPRRRPRPPTEIGNFFKNHHPRQEQLQHQPRKQLTRPCLIVPVLVLVLVS